DGEPDHLEPVGPGRKWRRVDLEWLGPRWNENQQVEPERLAGIGGQQQVTDMGWIEGAPENPNAHFLRRWHYRRCRRGTTRFIYIAVVGVGFPHRIAQVASILGVLDRPI